MIKIEITIPLRYNDGSPIGQNTLDKIKRDLLNKFNGLSISAEIQGFWTKDNITYNDYNKIYTVIAESDTELELWLSIYKKWLEHMLDQKEIFIIISIVQQI